MRIISYSRVLVAPSTASASAVHLRVYIDFPWRRRRGLSHSLCPSIYLSLSFSLSLSLYLSFYRRLVSRRQYARPAALATFTTVVAKTNLKKPIRPWNNRTNRDLRAIGGRIYYVFVFYTQTRTCIVFVILDHTSECSPVIVVTEDKPFLTFF